MSRLTTDRGDTQKEQACVEKWVWNVSESGWRVVIGEGGNGVIGSVMRGAGSCILPHHFQHYYYNNLNGCSICKKEFCRKKENVTFFAVLGLII